MSTLYFIGPPLPHYIVSAEDTYESGQAHPRRSAIGVFDMLIVSRGELIMREGERNWTIGPGEGVILRPDRTHEQPAPCRSRTHFYIVHFHSAGLWGDVGDVADRHAFDRPDWLRAEIKQSSRLSDMAQVFVAVAGAVGHTSDVEVDLLDPFALLIPQYFRLAAPEDSYGIMRELIRLKESPQAFVKWRQQELFQQILRSIAESRQEVLQPSDALAEAAAEYLRKHYREPITNVKLQEVLHFHPNYISRCMKTRYGCTPLHYLHGYRIEQAKRLLMNTDLPVMRIAEEVGFLRVAHFSRSFTETVGLSPARFRKRFRVGL